MIKKKGRVLYIATLASYKEYSVCIIIIGCTAAVCRCHRDMIPPTPATTSPANRHAPQSIASTKSPDWTNYQPKE